MTDAGFCILEHDPPRHVMRGLRVCTAHRWQILDATAQLPALHAHLAEWLTRKGGSGAPVTGSRDPGLSLNSEAVKARDHIAMHLSCWVRIAAEEHAWLIPPLTRVGDSPDPITAHAHWIAQRVDWYLAQPWALEFSRETLNLRAEGRRLRQPNRTRQFQLQRPCPHDGCEGWLVTELRPADDLWPSLIWCDATADHDDPHQWPADEWLRRLAPAVMAKEETG